MGTPLLTNENPTRILIASDQQLFRQGFRSMLVHDRTQVVTTAIKRGDRPRGVIARSPAAG
jgi:hypothetical protein